MIYTNMNLVSLHEDATSQVKMFFEKKINDCFLYLFPLSPTSHCSPTLKKTNPLLRPHPIPETDDYLQT